MRGAVLYGPRDVRFEERDEPKIIEPTDAIIRLSATCVCGSDLWPYRGVEAPDRPTPMGHEYCGLVEEVVATSSPRGGADVVARRAAGFRSTTSLFPTFCPLNHPTCGNRHAA